MGYGAHSPVKQVWLPLNYEFISDHDGDPIGDFAKAYKEKYGIDLHDIFSIYKDESASPVEIGVKIKNRVGVSTYSEGKVYGYLDVNYVNYNGVKFNTDRPQGNSSVTIFTLGVYGNEGEPLMGYGVNFNLPSSGVNVNTIDDLFLSLSEI